VIVSIHQPQYIPWLPYLTKIEKSDVFIILDSVDFHKNGLQNRNQIKTAQGAHWLTVPVKQRLGQKIQDVQINNSTDWRRKHWQTWQQYYGKAQFFKLYQYELEAFYSREWSMLNEFNIELLTTMLRWMNIQTPVRRSSQMSATGVASELVLNLCREAGATHYLSGMGGKNYLEPKSFNQAGVDLVYLPATLPDSYAQLFPKVGFMNHLSALDIIFNCGDTWRSYLPSEVIKA